MKTKRIRKIAIASTIVAAFAAAVIGILSAFGINLFSCTKTTDLGEAPESLNISAAPPTDGSLPTAHTGLENISYMVYVLANQDEWHSYSYTVSDAAGGINHQLTYTYKDYRDGVLVASDMTSSSFVKSSTQTLYVKDDAYTRTGSEPTSDNINDIVWNEDTPEYLGRQAYYEKYGLFADEISVFILNEESVASCGEVTANEDGTYTQSFTLDNDVSTYYYKCNMKTRGGLSSYPEFSTVNVTFTFNSSWEVLAISTTEVAAVKMGVISTTNTSVSDIEFTYGEGCVDEDNYGYYESFFKQYVGNVTEGSVDAETELTVVDALQYGFGEVLSGGKQYQIDLVAGDNVYTGYVYASVDLNTLSSDPYNALDIRLSLGETLDEQMLYLEFAESNISVYYSDSFAVSANISELKLIIDSFSSWLGTVNSSSDGGTVAVSKSLTADGEDSSDDVLTALLNDFKITETETGATIALDTENLLGTGIGIKLSLDFEKNDETVLTFTGAKVDSVSYGGTEINVDVTLSDTAAEVITRNEEMTPVSLAGFTADVFDLLNSELLDINIALDGNAANYAALDGLKVEATAQLTLEKIVAGVDLYVEYAVEGGSVSAKLSAYYDYNASEYGDIYLYLSEFDGEEVDVKVYCDIADLAETVELLLGKFVDGEQLDEATEEASEGVAEIINSVLSLDFSQVITDLYASGSEIRLGVDLDQIMTLLGASGIPSLGTAALVLGSDSLDLSLEAIGLTIGVSGSTGSVEQPSADGYLDASKVLDDVYGLLSSDSIALTIALDGTSGGCTVEALSGVKATLDANIDADELTLSSDITFSYTYNNNVISASLALWYAYDGENYGTVYANLYKVCGTDVSVKVSCGISDVLSLVNTLAGEITLFADGGSETATADILSALVKFDYSSVLTTLATTEQGLTVGINIDSILTQLGADDISVGTLAMEYTAGSALTVDLASVGVSASLSSGDKAVTLPDDIGSYYDIADLAGYIASLVNSEAICLAVNIGGDNGAFLNGIIENEFLAGLEISGKIYMTTDSFTLLADLGVSYAYNGEEVSLGLQAYYDGTSVSLLVDEINGTATSIGVDCKIETLSGALESVMSLTGDEGTEVSIDTANIITALVGMDYNKVLTAAATEEGALTVGCDIDALLSELANYDVISEVSLGEGKGFGTVAFGYNPAKGTLTLTAADLGIGASISGYVAFSKPQAAYLSVEDVLTLVDSVKEQIAAIEEAKAVAFGIECYATVLDLTVGIEGEGEVCWTTDADTGDTSLSTVAIYLSLYIADGSSDSKKDSVDVYVIYDAASQALTMTVGELGITADSEDFTTLQSGFNDLLEAICTLAGVSTDSLSASELVASSSGTDVSAELNNLLLNGSLTTIVTCLLDIVSSDGWVNALNGMSLSVDSVSAALSGLGGYKLTFDASEGFSLKLVSDSESGNENCISVTAGGNNLYSEIAEELEDGSYTIMTADESTKLTEVIYNYALGLISNASIANVLGTDTYEISFILEGDYTGVASLEGVSVKATLYYTDSVEVSGTESKLAEMDVNINVDGVTAVFNIKYYNDGLYVTLTEINGTTLNDLKLTIGLGDIYAIADELVDVLLNTNLTSYFASGASAVNEEVEEETASKLSETLVKLLSLDFDSIITASTTTENGTVTRSVSVDIDAIYKAFAETETDLGLGSVTAEIIMTDNGDGTTDRKIKVTGVYGENEAWLSVTLGRANPRDYTSFKTDITNRNYWDLAFVKYLVSDIVDFATDDNGDIYEIYSFSGNLTASIDLSSYLSFLGTVDIPINVLNLTVGIDSNGHLYVTLLGDLDTTTVAGITVTEDWLMGFNMSYSEAYGGYLVTCANNLGTDSAQYQVMTLDYLIDKLLTSSSCLQFMLGTNATIWSAICYILNKTDVSLDSGVMTPDTLYLTSSGYSHEEVTESETSEFDIATIITGITARIDGQSYSSGYTGEDDSAVSKTELSSQIGTSDYYAIDLNNTSIASLTSNGITEIYAALLRNSYGISGLVANGSVGGVLDFEINLTYNEGLDQVYDVNSSATTLYSKVETAPAESEFYTEAGEGVDKTTCFYIDENDNYVAYDAASVTETTTLYVFSNNTYYVRTSFGAYELATDYSADATYYTAESSTDIREFYAPNLYQVVLKNYSDNLDADSGELDFDRYTEGDDSTDTFGCFSLTYNGSTWTGSYTDHNALYKGTLTIIYPDGTSTTVSNLKYTSTIYAEESQNILSDNSGKYVYYYLDGDTKVYIGETYTYHGISEIYAEVRCAVTVNYYNNVSGKLVATITSFEGNTISTTPDGYTLLGSATITEDGDEISETLSVLNKQGRVITVSGEFVVAEYKINGITYTYNTSIEGYEVSGVSGDGYSGSTLMFENEIDGYEVKQIADSAFSGVFVSGNSLYGTVTTIIVPENITEIQGKAFYGCTYLRTVIFLAETINMYNNVYGTAAKEPQGFAFYECSAELTVYYTNVEAELYNDENWCWEYNTNWKVITTTVDEVNAISGNDTAWAYSVGEITKATDDSTLNSLIKSALQNYCGITSGVNEDDIRQALQDVVDAYTLENEGYVGYYRVYVTIDAQADGRYNEITVSIASGCDVYYKLDIDAGYGKVTISADDDIYYYNSETYVKAGTTITLTVSDIQEGYSFAGYEANKGTVTCDSDEYMYEMPSEAVTITAKYKVAEATVTVYSEVSFTYDYNGTTLTYIASSDATTETPASTTITAVSGATLTTSLTATESGYYFLGWAQVSETSGELEFVTDLKTTDGMKVYAIWGKSSQTVKSYSLATEGTALATDLTADNATFYDWYSDGSFTTELSTISTSNTVFYARWEINVDFSFSCGDSKLVVDGSTYAYTASSSDTLKCTYTFKVLEGYCVKIVYSKTSSGYIGKYNTLITLTVYDSEEYTNSVESHTLYLNKNSNNNGNRYLSINYISSNWTGTTSGSDLTSGTAYAKIYMYTYITY